MARKLLIILSAVLGAVTIGLLVWYLVIRTSSARISPSLDAVPPDAGMILVVKDPFVHARTLFSRPYWNAADSVGSVAVFSSGFRYIDSLLRTNERTQELTSGFELVISAHPSAGGTDFFYAFNLKSKTPDNFIDQFVQKASKESKLEKIKTAAGEIRTLKMRNGSGQFCYTVSRGLFIASTSYSLVEASLNQLRSEKKWLNDRQFQWVRKSVSADKKVQLYFRFDQLSGWLGPYGNSSSENIFRQMAAMGGWAGGAVVWDDAGLQLSGTAWADSSVYLLHLVGQADKPEEDIADRLPSGTVLFTDYGWSDALQLQYEKSGNGADATAGEWTESLRSRVCFFVTAEPSGDIHHFALMDYNEPETKWNDFVRSAASVADTFSYNGYGAVRLENTEGLELLPFSGFSSEDTLYACMMDEYILLGNGEQAIRDYIGKYISNQTLSSQSYYNAWRQQVPASGDLTVYFHPSPARGIMQAFLKEEAMESWDWHQALWKMMPSAGCVLTRKQGYFSLQAAVLLSTDVAEELQTEWETELGAEPVTAPVILHGVKDTLSLLVFQDSANTLYGMDEGGNIRWKRNMDGRIIGASYPVSFYENGPQLVFCTSSYIYAIDRDGKNLPGFPQEIPGRTKSGLSVVNYGGDDGYRIFAITESNGIMLRDRNGAEVEGWQKQQLPGPPAMKPEHIAAGGKDHLVMVLGDGTVLVTDRQGRTMIELPGAVKDRTSAPLLVKNNSLSSSAVVCSGSDGICRIVYLDASKQPDTYLTLPGSRLFDYTDSDNDGVKEFWMSDGQHIAKVDRKGTTLASFDLPSVSPVTPGTVRLNGKLYVWLAVPSEEKLYVLDNDLVLVEGFPVRGSGQTGFVKTQAGYTLLTGYRNRLMGYRWNGE